MISTSIYKTHNEAPLFSCQETKDTCLLVVDDNDLDRMRVRRLLDDRYRVVEADTDLCAEALLLLHRPDCVLLDYPIAGMDTLTFVETCAQYHIPVVMLTEGVHDDTIEAQRMQRRAHDPSCSLWMMMNPWSLHSSARSGHTAIMSERSMTPR